jgi:hypothetical protein
LLRNMGNCWKRDHLGDATKSKKRGVLRYI